MERHRKVQSILLAHADHVKGQYEAPWLDEKPLSARNANKFFLGSVIDYRILANSAWSNARRLSEITFGDPPRLWNHIVDSYTRDQWRSKKRQFRLHWLQAAHDRVWRIGSEIVRRYDGDARNIWQRQTADSVLSALEVLRCGPEISRMIVGCLITYGLIDGKGDVKADVHVCRVLGRIFDHDLQPVAARQLAMKIHPDNPWELDIALYDIGKTFCKPDRCDCEECPIGEADQCQDYIRYKASQGAAL